MEKTRNKTYTRIGDCLRVSGFRTTDTYEDTLQKATCSFDDAAQADVGTLIISLGTVANCPPQNGKRWTLGGYLDELGGITMGVYLYLCTCIDINITKHTCKFIQRTYLHIFRTTVIRFTSTRYSSVSKALYQIIV